MKVGMVGDASLRAKTTATAWLLPESAVQTARGRACTHIEGDALRIGMGCKAR